MNVESAGKGGFMNMRIVAVVLILLGVLILIKLFFFSAPQAVEKVVYVSPSPVPTKPKAEPTIFGKLNPPDNTFDFQADDPSWRSIGQGRITIDVSGAIDYGGEKATPEGSRIMGNYTAKAEGISFGVLIAKIGENGVPFKVGAHRVIEAGDKTVFIAINDSRYTDNYGAYHIRITR